MRQRLNQGSLMILVVVLAIGVTDAVTVWAEQDLERRASWQQPSREAIQIELNEWLDSLELSGAQRTKLDAQWQAGDETWKTLIDSFAAADRQLADIIESCRNPLGSGGTAEDLPLDQYPAFVANNMKLLIGKTMAVNQLYNEAHQLLQGLETSQVADPASLLFYLAAAQYRLREKEDGLFTIERLLEREDELPTRFITVAKLIQADLEKLKVDSLDEVARIMDSIRVRLGHGRAGQRVRKEEQEVIDKLDKMIDQLEQQLQQMQQQGGGGAGGIQSNQPAEDSSLPGGSGPGDVDKKDLGDATDWGNLPPKQRREALQRLGKEFPSHYRDVIEEYFRQLARDEESGE